MKLSPVMVPTHGNQPQFLGFCFLFDPHVKLFLVQHIRSAISEIQKRPLQLDLFHILLQLHLTPAPHHPVYFYSYWQPSTYLSAIFYISQSFIFLNFTALYHPHKHSAVEFFTPSHPIHHSSASRTHFALFMIFHNRVTPLGLDP